MLVFPLTSAWSTTLTKFHKSPAIENSTTQNHFMQQYKYLKYSTTFIMFCLLVHGIFMHLIVTYVIYFKQYFLLMVPHSTFFWNSNICVLFLELMMIIFNRAHPTTEDRFSCLFFEGGLIQWWRHQKLSSPGDRNASPITFWRAVPDLLYEQLLLLPGL